MKQYQRTSVRKAILNEYGTHDFDGAIAGIAQIRNTGRSLSSVQKKRARKAAAKAASRPVLPKRMDIESILEVEDFLRGSVIDAGWRELERVMKLIIVDIDQNLREKAKRWAKETLAEMKAVTPVDSGNLRDSLAILTKNANSLINNELNIVDKKGPISVRVGIDEQRLLPPPTYKPSTKRFVKDPVTHQPTSVPVKVRIPPYNYAPLADKIIKLYHTEGYLGYDFLEKWQEIALNNLERIFS